jgi:hypothetical protein
MALNLARFNGNLNPDKPDDETVLAYLQKQRLAQAAQANNDAQEARLGATNAFNLSKAQYDLGREKAQNDILDPQVLAGLRGSQGVQGTQPAMNLNAPSSPNAAKWGSGMQAPQGADIQGTSPEYESTNVNAPLPAVNLAKPSNPVNTYNTDLATSNTHSQAALDAEKRRLDREGGMSAALGASPVLRDKETRDAQNEKDLNDNIAKGDALTLNKDKAGVMAFLKPKLDSILTAHAGEMSKGDYNGMQADLMKNIPFNFLPDAKEYMTLADKQKPKTEFNMNPNPGQITRAEVSAEGRIGGVNKAKTASYETVKDAALAFNQDYNTYQEAMATGDKQGMLHAQIGMLDKFITSSTRKATGEAQFLANTASPGLLNSLDNMKDKILNGSPLSQDQIETLHDLTMRTAESMRQKVKQVNAATAKNVEHENKSHNFTIDPESVITDPQEMLSQDSASFALPVTCIPGIGKKPLTPQQTQLRGKYNY